MSDILNERSQKILLAIIEDHIESAEPVGSRAVTKRHDLGLSPATVRNVMSDLEELGYIGSPHTSAGRVPTEKGYRFYVDSLLCVKQLSRQAREQIRQQYPLKGVRVEELLREAGRVLSKISKYAGVVMAPRFATTVFRHIEFVKLSAGKVLVVFVARSGLVQNKIIETEEDISQRDLEKISSYLNHSFDGFSIQEIKSRISHEVALGRVLYDKLQKRALHLSCQALSEELGGQIFIEGTSNILEQPEFADLEKMKRLLRTFDQKSLLMELLDKSQRAEGVQIFIGDEAEYSGIKGCSLITSTYSSSKGAVGTLGIIGPSRMPYSMVIPMVDYTARLVSQKLENESE